MKTPSILACVLLALIGVARPALADKADQNQPMNIEADALRYDDLKQVSIFSGRVVLTKGTIQIRGQQLEVRQDPQGYQFGLVTGSATEPAFFRQKREGVDEFIEGEGETITYDGKADTVTFTRKASLRRYRSAALADEITGAVIVYDNQNDQFRVDGSARNAAAGTASGRVRAMLTPKPEGKAAAPSPAASAAPGPALRATTTLPGVTQ